MFDESSIVVRAWVRKIEAGVYTREQVPALGNLRDVVLAALGPEK